MSMCTETTMAVAPVGYANGGNGNGNGMWGDGGWWFIIILALLFGGFGYGGYGYGARGGATTGGGAVDGYVLTSDFANIERKIDTVQSGLCDGFYAMNTGMLNGFAGVNQTVSNGFATLNTNLCQLGNNVAQGQNATAMSIMGAQNALQAQIADCCCTNRYDSLQSANATQSAIAQTNYNIATQACDTRGAINDGVRAILDKLTAQEIAAKDATIAAQSQQLFAAQLAASQAQQNEYLVGRLAPCPIPAYPACPTSYRWASVGEGCGCGYNG